jgi:hypothetical protein
MADSRMDDSPLARDDEEIDLEKIDDDALLDAQPAANRYANAPSLPVNKNTAYTKGTGVLAFKRAMLPYNMTIETLTDTDITSEMFNTFAGHAFLLRKPDGSIYKPKSLGEYYRKAKEEIRRKFKSHPYWNTIIEDEAGRGLTGDAFCLSLAADLEKEVGREGNATAEDESSPPVYRSSLLTAIRSILSQSSPSSFEDAFLVVVTYSAMGRGGEGRLMSWKSTVLDSFMQMLVSRWFEEKTIRGYPLSFFADLLAELDLFFLANGFFMNGGLYRAATADAIQFSRVFSKRSNFATDISKLLKQHSGVKGATSRSLRRATCTVTFASRKLLEKDSNARGGWLPTDNKKYYISSSVETTIPAGIFLAGHETVPEKVTFPSLPGGLKTDEWEDVMSCCYEPISLPEFKPKGRLRPLLEICLASMLRYYVDVSRRYQGNDNCTVSVVLRKLRGAVAKQPSFLASGKSTPHVFLGDLSREVCNTWEEKNLPEDNNQDLLDLVASQSKRQVATDAKVARLEAMIQSLGDGQDRMYEGQQKLIQVVLESRSMKSPANNSPPNRSPKKRKIYEDDDDDDDDDYNSDGSPGDEEKKTSSSKEGGGGGGSSSSRKAEGAGGPKHFLNFGSGAPISGKDVSLSSLLYKVSSQKEMGSILTSTFNYQEKAKVKVALRCMDAELTDDERNGLKDGTKTVVAIMEICTGVEERCMEKIHNLEVETGIHKPKENSTYKDRRTTAYFLGFAARVGKLKEKDGSW